MNSEETRLLNAPRKAEAERDEAQAQIAALTSSPNKPGVTGPVELRAVKAGTIFETSYGAFGVKLSEPSTIAGMCSVVWLETGERRGTSGAWRVMVHPSPGGDP